jgi:hypothetical protein
MEGREEEGQREKGNREYQSGMCVTANIRKSPVPSAMRSCLIHRKRESWISGAD